MNLRQQIVETNVQHIGTTYKLNRDLGFMRYVHSLYTNTSINSFDENDLVDGGQDKQIDIITIEEEKDEATVYVIQAKNTRNFSSNAIIQLRNGLTWLFRKNRRDLDTLTNKKFKDKILEYREIQSSYGPSNLNIKVAFITNGVRGSISDEFRQEEKTIKDEYDNDTFASFSLDIWGSDEILDCVNVLDKKNRKVTTEIKIRYDTNTPSMIKYYNQGLTGIVCTTTANEIARVVNDDRNGYVFDLNIRKYLGTRGSVNSDILRTCTDVKESYLFWFLNNGITIVCDKADAVNDPDNPHIKVDNMQIVNGCQTATTLALADKQGILKKDARVMLRIYQTDDLDLVDKIVLTTNNQNKINGRNLKANEKQQIDLEKGFKIYDYCYERKPRQYIDDTIQSDRIVSNDIVAVAYLAIVLKICSDARSRKYKVWDEYYSRIFSGKIIEPYLVSYLIYRKVYEYLNNIMLYDQEDERERFLARNSTFHVSRITAFLLKGDDQWDDVEKLKKCAAQIKKEAPRVEKAIEKAFSIVKRVLDRNYQGAELNTVLKLGQLDSDLTSYLHTKHQGKTVQP